MLRVVDPLYIKPLPTHEHFMGVNHTQMECMVGVCMIEFPTLHIIISRSYTYIYIYIHVHIYTYTYIHIYIYIHTCTQIYIYIYIYIYVHTWTHIYIYIYIYIYTYMYTYIHIHIYIYIYRYRYRYIYIYVVYPTVLYRCFEALKLRCTLQLVSPNSDSSTGIAASSDVKCISGVRSFGRGCRSPRDPG